MPGPNSPYSPLDMSQVIRQCFDESQDKLRVDATVSIPPGGATEAKQDDQIVIETAIQVAVESIDSKIVTVDTDDVTITSSALPTGAATEAKQDTGNTSLASIDTKLSSQATAANQATANASLSSIDGNLVLADTDNVTIISSTLPTGGATSALQTSGNASLTSIDGKIVAVDTGDVTISSSALPTGASTSALQTSGNASLTSIDGKITAVDTGAVVIASSALPTGAATSANQTTTNASLASIDTKLTSPLATVEAGYTLSQFIRNDYTGTPVTTGAYVQLIASTSNAYREIEIFDSSGQTLKIAYGAAASEVDQFLVFPGGNGRIRFNVPTATRISIRAVSANATEGEISVNFYG